MTVIETEEACGVEESIDSYVNAPDLFYWMEEEGDADIPLGALSIQVPTGCRFCI